MASEPDPERLRKLEERLAGLQQGPKQKKRHAVIEGFSQGEMAWRMVIEMAVSIAVGAAMGYGLDRLLGTLPVFLIILCLLGFAAGVRSILKTAREMMAKEAAQVAATGNSARRAEKKDV